MSYDAGHGDDAVAPDDLAQISGIGSKTARALHAADIRTYAELASRSAADIARVVRGVAHPSPKQIDGWRNRARVLAAAASGAAPQAVPRTPVGLPGDEQREESFMVRVLVNEDGSIRRMTAQHVGKGTKAHWPRLERDAQRDALFGFIETAISAPAMAAETPAQRPSDQVHQAGAARATAPPAAESQPAAASAARIGAQPARLAPSAVLSMERAALRAAEPFAMTMTIDLAETASHTDRLAYSAVIVARPLAGGPKQTVARSDGLLAATSPAISIAAAGLPAGAYRFDGAVSLREPGSDQPVGLAALAEGLLVQVLPG